MKVKVFNVGSCNGCDIEVLAWAVERGIELVDEAAEADLYVVTGSLTLANARRLLAVADRLEPKPVLLVGTCAIGQRLFVPAEADLSRFDFLFEGRRTAVFGCPPSPDEIESGVDENEQGGLEE